MSEVSRRIDLMIKKMQGRSATEMYDEIYRLGLGVQEPEEINPRLREALNEPIRREALRRRRIRRQRRAVKNWERRAGCPQGRRLSILWARIEEIDGRPRLQEYHATKGFRDYRLAR